MPATRSRTSTEQAAEVASEEVKTPPTETEPVVAPAEDVKEAEAAVVEPVVAEAEEAAPAEAVATTEAEAEPAVIEPVVASENGNAEAIPAEAEPVVAAAENGNGAEAVAEGDELTGEKRKSLDIAGGEGDGPDSTEAVAAKKAKVDEDVEPAVAEPVVDATA